MILDEIVAKRKEQLARELQRTDRETMRKLALQTEREVYSFPDALKSGRLSIIAEVKKASPSKSVICADFHPVELDRGTLFSWQQRLFSGDSGGSFHSNASERFHH